MYIRKCRSGEGGVFAWTSCLVPCVWVASTCVVLQQWWKSLASTHCYAFQFPQHKQLRAKFLALNVWVRLGNRYDQRSRLISCRATSYIWLIQTWTKTFFPNWPFYWTCMVSFLLLCQAHTQFNSWLWLQLVEGANWLQKASSPLKLTQLFSVRLGLLPLCLVIIFRTVICLVSTNVKRSSEPEKLETNRSRTLVPLADLA